VVVAFAVVAAAVVLIALPAGAKVPGPNGRIAFARQVDSAGDTVTYTVNPDGTQLKPLFTVDFSGSPRWSPDGSQVAILSAAGRPRGNVSAVIVNPDTGSYRVLLMVEPKTLFTPCWVWSADGQRLACEGQGKTDPSLNGIYTIQSSDGRGLTRITNAGGLDDIPIDYSPDGKQILFCRTDPSAPRPCVDKQSALFVVNVDGSGLHQITPGGFSDDDGSWSPDGTKIAFEHSGALFVVRPDGTGLAKIPLAIGSHSPAGDFSWSPDGTKIIFLLVTPTGEGIATANADGSNVQQITNSPTFDHQTDWGPHPLITP
jgi:Tol biopolymer transport system component